MKIRSQITVLLVVTALVMPASFVGALYAVAEVRQGMHDIAAAEDLIGSATQLRLVAVETVLFHEARSQDQWERKTASTLRELSRMPTNTPAELTYVTRIRNNIMLAQSIYPRLTKAGKDDSISASLQASLEARTVNSLSVITQEVMDAGNELIHINREEAEKAIHLMQAATAMVALTLGGVIFFVWRLVKRDILWPLNQFERGTEKIAAGDYAFRLNLHYQNELGSLANAFDTMTAHVQKTQSDLVVEAANSHRAELALQESVQYTQAILDNAADGILTIDQVGTIRSANNAVEEIFGYTQNELVGQNISLLTPDIHTASLDGPSDKIPASQAPASTATRRELDGVRKNGQRFPVELAVSRSLHLGQPLFVGLVQDISERRRIEQMKSEFVSTVSHELRTPLTSIGGSLSLVLGGAVGEVPAAMRPMLAIAQNNSARLTLLINDLLDMEKLMSGNLRIDFQAQPLMRLVDQAVDSIRAYGEPLKVTFGINERADTACVNVDGNRLQQVLANFLSNAAKFSPTGEQVRIVVSAGATTVRVSVIDRGPGIPQEFRKRIFQKFAQADSSDTRQKGGTGLGLAISKELILRMHGQIGFTSEEGAGSCFYFDLPLCDERQDEA